MICTNVEFSREELSRILCYELYRSFDKLNTTKVLLNCGLIDHNLADFSSINKLKDSLMEFPLDTIDVYFGIEYKTLDIVSLKRIEITDKEIIMEDKYGRICLCRC